MENELTYYGTPAQDTPYCTPASTPRRVPYRVNPVKMIRQQVPVKIASTEDAKITSTDSDSLGTSRSMNPMKTKRVKCTIQPSFISSVIDYSVGDQPIYHPTDTRLSHTFVDTQSTKLIPETAGKSASPSILHSSSANVVEIRPSSVCCARGDAETAQSNASSQVIEADSSIRLPKEQIELVTPSSDQIIAVHSKVDYFDSVQKSFNEIAPSVEQQRNYLGENMVPSLQHSLHEEFISDSKLPSTSPRKCEFELEQCSETQKEILITQKLLDIAAPSFHHGQQTCDKTKEPAKPSNMAEKVKRTVPNKKPTQNQESNVLVGHKCDKKKFYDPTDIRKYMIKKKFERQAKEKEEKSRKANELAALKRKTEITKTFAQRSRLPVSTTRHSRDNLIKDIPNGLKMSKKIQNIKSSKRLQPYETFKGKSETHCYHQKFHQPMKTDIDVNKQLNVPAVKSNTKPINLAESKFDKFGDVNKREIYFKKRFDDIISICAKEASKIVSAELQSTAEGLSGNGHKCFTEAMPTRAATGDNQLTLSSSLDELKYKNPYNFMNILKGKVNLVQDDELIHNQPNKEAFVTPVKQPKTTHSYEVEGTAAPHKRCADEKFIFKHLKPELTLSDLNLSVQKYNETYRASPEKMSNDTFVVPDRVELRRKPARTLKNIESKENMDTSLALSGVQPLPPFKPFVSTPLTEKNSHNIPRVLDFTYSKNESTLDTNDKKVFMSDNVNRVSSLGKTFSSQKILDQSKNHTSVIKDLVDDDLLRVNSDSLKVQNTSLLLPESAQLCANSICDINRSRLASLDKIDSVLNTDFTLTNIFLDEGDSCSKLVEDLNLSRRVSVEGPQMNSSLVLEELYDQMIKSEDEKLLQILKKIHQQKESLNKYLRTEVFALEVQKNEFKNDKDEEKIKTIKKKQRGILLKVTKSILELDKMKKSVIETVDRRKSDLLKQKIAMKQRKSGLKPKSPSSKPHSRPSDANSKKVLVTKQTKTFFGISSSSLTSIVVENGNEVEANTIEKNEQFNSEVSDCIRRESTLTTTSLKENGPVKDTATSPISFNGGISIRLDLDPEKLIKLKNSFAEIQIHPVKSTQNSESIGADKLAIHQDQESGCFAKDGGFVQEPTKIFEPRSIKIKRPLSPVVLPPSKKVLQIRRMSSSSDLTLPSLNDTTTTDQSDIELRISALQEQLRQRKLEAEKLRREEKQLRKEKLKTKEQSLLKQLEAYDEYIKKVSKMLTENVTVSAAAAKATSEMKKPLIKFSSALKHSHDSSAVRQSSMNESRTSDDAQIGNKNTCSNTVLVVDDRLRKKHVDEVETNTEDSEKQLRKADSGILIESEVTEPSEAIDLLRPKSQPSSCSVADRASTLAGAKVNNKLSIESAENDVHVAAEGTDVVPDAIDVSPDGSQSKDLLRMISDLQSEVHSLSEQLYSSDFVEDIPEDLADTKSEVSESVTNDNTSLSIDEILSDRLPEPASSSDREVTPSNADVPFFAGPENELSDRARLLVDDDDETTPRAGSTVEGSSEPEVIEPSSGDATDPLSEFKLHVQTIENLESVDSESAEDVLQPEHVYSKVEIVPNTTSAADSGSRKAFFHPEKMRSKVENVTNVQPVDIERRNDEVVNRLQDVAAEMEMVDEDFESANAKLVKETVSIPKEISASLESVLVKSVSLSPSPEEQLIVDPTNRVVDTSTDGDGDDFDFYDVKNFSDIDSVDVDVDDRNQWPTDGGDTLTAGTNTLSVVVEEIRSTGSLENASNGGQLTSKFDASDEFASKTSHELIKFDYVHESEGSNVADVNVPVEPLREVATMMDGLKSSDTDEMTDVVESGDTDGLKRNYDNVLTNLRSYFDAKTAAGDVLVADTPSFNNPSSAVRLAEFRVAANADVSPVPQLPDDSRVSVDNNLEETDISESLEYDAVPVGMLDETIPSILDDDVGKFALFGGVDDAAAPSSAAMVTITRKSATEDVSHEKDRSVEEHVEDFSVPNLMGTTFLVHDCDSDSSETNRSGERVERGSPSPQKEVVARSPAPAEAASTAAAAIADADLEQITEGQTPFLRALKREQENLLARRQESVDKITVDLFESLIEETCADLVYTMSRKTRSCDFGLSSTGDHSDISEIPNIINKVNDSFDKDKSADVFDNWLERRLNLDQDRLREAEELRLQQIKIEQEIEELQAQQQIPPYIYLREIPNKPPPPYTPPADQSLNIPSNESELGDFVSSTIEYVCEELYKGNDVDQITQRLPSETNSGKGSREISAYQRFLFDLTKEIAKNVLVDTKKCECLPWEEVARQKVPKPMPAKEELRKIIDNEIKVLFGFRSKIGKEKLIIQWSRKRRSDFVDDLLIQELQDEEGEWTNYEKDELIIKNQITESLLDDLLEDTVISLEDAFRGK